MNHVFTRKLNERPVLSLNRELQPVSKNRKVVAELSSFLGTIARLYIPLDFVNWSKVPEEEKDGWWEYVKVSKKHYSTIFIFTELFMDYSTIILYK